MGIINAIWPLLTTFRVKNDATKHAFLEKTAFFRCFYELPRVYNVIYGIVVCGNWVKSNYFESKNAFLLELATSIPTVYFFKKLRICIVLTWKWLTLFFDLGILIFHKRLEKCLFKSYNTTEQKVLIEERFFQT